MSRGTILAIHRYFWPDTPPYAALLRTITAQWAQSGYDVEVLSSQPSYKAGVVIERAAAREDLDGVRVRRLDMLPDTVGRWRKPRNMVRFTVLVVARILFGRRRDVVMCSTAPQVVLGWATSVAARARGSRFVYHCMDLHPEIGALSGEFANPLVYRLLRHLDTSACRRAAAVVVLSEDMRRSLLRRDPRLEPRIVVLNNFELPDHGRSQAASPLPRGRATLRIAFTGNIGRFQGLERIARAVLTEDSRLDDLELVLMGEGAASQAIEQLVAAAPSAVRHRVRLLPHGSPAEARALLRTSDLGLVSLVPHVIEFAYPSKTATYLSEALPLLVSVEPDSELARMVEREHIGWCVPDDEASLVALLADACARPDLLDEMRERALGVWRKSFAADEVLPRWSALLADVLEGRVA